jgi:hypothetical protein
VAHASKMAAQKMPRKRGDVRQALAQGRQMHGQHVEPIEKVFPEAASGDRAGPFI